MNNIRKCICGTEMKLHREGFIDMRASVFTPVDDWIYLKLYLCPSCRRVEWVMPATPLEEFEAEQKAKENMTPVEKFEHTFRDYSEKHLQKVIDGRDYVDDAKKAARNLLYKRKYGE